MQETSASGRATRARRLRRTPARSKNGIGLALAGGGPLGGIYEVGALLALADSLDGIDFNDLDAYVGVSSGGFVAAALANGISPAQMYRLFIDDGADAALKPEMFLKPAFGEFGRCLAALPGLAARAAMQYLRDPFIAACWSRSRRSRRRSRPACSTTARSTPSSRACSPRPGAPTTSASSSRKLFLVATNLDTGASVVFGAHQHAHVPISRAIEASSALPGLFPAGGDRRRALRRRRAQQDAACVGRARRGCEARCCA